MKRIVFGLDLSYPWSRPVHEGFCRPARERGWRVLLSQHHGKALLDERGILKEARIPVAGWITTDAGVALACRRLKLPCVLMGIPATETTPCATSVWTDYREMGAMAAREFIRRSFPSVGFLSVGSSATWPMRLKEAGFRATGGGSGRHLLDPPPLDLQSDWPDEASIEKLARWLKRAPAPLGLATASLEIAWALSRALHRSGRKSPEQVAVISVGEDAALLEQADPPITGILEDGHTIGATAARYLADQMAGRKVPLQTLIPPLRLIPRASSDFLAVSDPCVNRALKAIWNSEEPITGVEELARAVHVSRATLLRRFREHRGIGPSEEIRRARLHKAMGLIQSTDLPMVEIAERTGYGLQSALSRAVREATGHPPRDFRNRAVLFRPRA